MAWQNIGVWPSDRYAALPGSEHFSCVKYLRVKKFLLRRVNVEFWSTKSSAVRKELEMFNFFTKVIKNGVREWKNGRREGEVAS